MKHVEAMYEPIGGLEECGEAEVHISPGAEGRIAKAIDIELQRADHESRDVDVTMLALDILQIANEETEVEENHVDFDPNSDGSLSPLDRLGSIRHKMMLAGILPHEIVAVVRLADLQALEAERDRFAAQLEESLQAVQ